MLPNDYISMHIFQNLNKDYKMDFVATNVDIPNPEIDIRYTYRIYLYIQYIADALDLIVRYDPQKFRAKFFPILDCEPTALEFSRTCKAWSKTPNSNVYPHHTWAEERIAYDVPPFSRLNTPADADSYAPRMVDDMLTAISPQQQQLLRPRPAGYFSPERAGDGSALREMYPGYDLDAAAVFLRGLLQ